MNTLTNYHSLDPRVNKELWSISQIIRLKIVLEWQFRVVSDWQFKAVPERQKRQGFERPKDIPFQTWTYRPFWNDMSLPVTERASMGRS